MTILTRKSLAFTLTFAIILLASPFQIVKSDQIDKRRSELKKLNQAIKNAKNKIYRLKRKERSAVSELKLWQKQSFQLNKYILLLDEQIEALEKEIIRQDSLFYGLAECRRDYLLAYAKVAREKYLKNETSVAETIVSDKPFAEEAGEIYIERFLENVDLNIGKIRALQIALSSKTATLREKFDYQTQLKELKADKQRRLNCAIQRSENLLTKIRRDKKQLQNELEKKLRSAKKLKSIISKLMKKDRGTSAKVLSIGKMDWPCASRKIFRSFGKVKNKGTNTYFDNPGIDIAIKGGSKVKAAARGKISKIHWLPGYGTLVIIYHGKGVRTVYANLSKALASENQRVNKGETIGVSGKSIEGEFLHFELWAGEKRLNPTKYLR